MIIMADEEKWRGVDSSLKETENEEVRFEQRQRRLLVLVLHFYERMMQECDRRIEESELACRKRCRKCCTTLPQSTLEETISEVATIYNAIGKS